MKQEEYIYSEVKWGTVSENELSKRLKDDLAYLEGGVQVHAKRVEVAVEDGRRQRVQEGHARHHVLDVMMGVGER